MRTVEFRLSYHDPRLKDNQQITRFVKEELAKRGLDMHMNDVVELIDDDDNQERILKVRTRVTTVYT